MGELFHGCGMSHTFESILVEVLCEKVMYYFSSFGIFSKWLFTNGGFNEAHLSFQQIKHFFCFNYMCSSCIYHKKSFKNLVPNLKPLEPEHKTRHIVENVNGIFFSHL